METKANYLLIGIFTLAGIVTVFGFLLWIANVQVNRQFAYYDVLFDSVSGLATASDVRFNGVPIGQVVALDLDPQDPSKVRVRLEVQADIPIKTDTIARLESLGVTGVGIVALSGGSNAAEDLPQLGVIQSERSALQSIFEGAPTLLTTAVDVLEDIQEVVNADNRSAVTDLLNNLASASGRLDRSLEDFEQLSSALGGASREIAVFTQRLAALSDTAEGTLNTATDTLNAAQSTAERAAGTLDTARGTFATADGLMKNELSAFLETGRAAAQQIDQTIGALEPALNESLLAAQDLLATRLPSLTSQVEDTAAALETQVNAVGAGATDLFEDYARVASVARARLEESATALAAFEAASLEAETALSTINQTIGQDLPHLFADLRSAAQSANRVIDEVGTGVSEVSSKLLSLSDEGTAALNAATETFSIANTTLNTITLTMGTAEQTLGSASSAFASMNRVIDEDLDAIVADVRGAVDAFTLSLENVSDDIGDISDEVLSASRSASDILGTVDGIVQENRRQVSDFLRVGLPQFQRFVEESRRLVVNLERLADRLERDPARFILGTQASEFNR
ncbi:MAG: MlaD family protein [Roseobacter sp.]